MPFTPGPRIYNLFPRLVGSMDRWVEHLPRIKAMGFDWVYVNPPHYAGYSGSLYAVKDYYAFHPLFVNANLEASPEAQFQTFLDAVHANGLKYMMDLVVNHTAFDSVLAETHPEWFKQTPEGGLKRPGCMDGDVWVEWGDLVEVDNAGSPDRQGLWSYWLTMMRHYLAMGVDGFRCDAAYHVPSELWQFLIPAVRQATPEVSFFAETLGCRPWQVIESAVCGFDYVFNSVCWWDFHSPWLLDGQGRVLGAAPSIGFAESHDTPRLAATLGSHPEAIKQKYLFSALYGTGVLMPVGFEFGFKQKLDVVTTMPDHWEEPALDLTGFIAEVHALKAAHRVFNTDGLLFPIETHNELVKAYVKTTPDAREKALFLLNLDLEHPQEAHLPSVADLVGVRSLRDVSLGERLGPIGEDLHVTLAPAACRVLVGDLTPAEAVAAPAPGVATT